MNGARILPLGQLVIKNKNDSQIVAIIPLRVTLEIIKVSFLRGFSYAQLFDNGQA